MVRAESRQSIMVGQLQLMEILIPIDVTFLNSIFRAQILDEHNMSRTDVW